MVKSFLSFFSLIIKQRYIIVSMAKREVANQYVGSILGFIWTFINPIVMVLVFWVVFSVGFKVKPTNDVPFVVWLTAGMASWFVFADIVIGSTGCIVSNSHLIKRTLFQSQILPVIRIVSCLITHSIFLIVLITLIILQKMEINVYYFQFLYYLFCLIFVGLGFGWATSALNVFIRDIGQIVGVIIQIGFWATPIFWDISIMPPYLQTAFKLNPMYYIVQGYRESFIYFKPFWCHPYQTIYFWFMAITIFTTGALIFRKLKPHFADIL
jgi:lipopolysaccharide transport system permease protein